MAKKATKKKAAPARPQLGDNVEILSAGEVIESPITDTLETNYMPYAILFPARCRKLTASSPPIANCCIPCTAWAC